jgi:putative ABC transport system permease protein
LRTRDVFSYSFSAIKLRKLRSGLTTLGIVIGIAAIVALMSYTQGFQVSITNQFTSGFATDTVTVSTRSSFPEFGGDQPSNFTLYVNDTAAVETLDLVKSATAVVTRRVDLNATAGQLSASATGVDFEKYSAMYSTQFVAELGVIPTTPDNNSVVIGHSIYDPYNNGTIFADVGDQLTLSVTIVEDGSFHEKNMTLTVVGVLGEIGLSFSGPSDTGVYIPVNLATSFFETDQANSILVQLVDGSQTTIDAATTSIQELFGGEVNVQSATAVLDTISTSLGTVELLLGGIASISLIVAGVGIMNIMIVSLMERTREIGILKAVGAKGRAILGVFLSEALIIGLAGGIIGIAAGYLIAIVFSDFLSGGFIGRLGGGGGTRTTFGNPIRSSLSSITPMLTPELILMALAFGMIVSVVFGLYPAWRASKLKPVDALRYE